MILRFLSFIGKIICCIVFCILAIPVILYTVFTEVRIAATKHPDRLKFSSSMEYELGDVSFNTDCLCNSLFWGDGKIARFFEWIRRLRGEIQNEKSYDTDPVWYWEQFKKEQEEMAKVLYEEYGIGDGTLTTIKEEREKTEEQKKILGQIITFSKKER